MIINFAHRGASGYYPENTMLAFEKAIEMGCSGIETDVHLTKDGVLVLCHDERLDRTTNGTGYIADYKYKELQNLDAGIWFGRKFKGLKIPSLDLMLECLGNKNIFINFELKNSEIEYKNLEGLIIKKIYASNMQERTIISSFNHYSIMKCKSLDSKIKLGFLYDFQLYKPGDYGRIAGIDAMHPNFKTLNEEVVENIKRNGLMINTYTVDDEEDMRSMLELGVDGIFTNYPDRLNKIIRQ